MVIKDANLDIIATRRSQYPDDGRPELVKVVLLILFYPEIIWHILLLSLERLKH